MAVEREIFKRPGAGRRAAREIQRHRLARNRQVESDLQRFVADAVIVEKILGRIDAILQVRDAGAHQLAARLRNCTNAAGNGLVPILIKQRRKPAHAEIERVDLPVQVAIGAVRQPRIRGHDVDDVGAQFAPRQKA